ncbi:envelope glycoprotein E [Ateline alphaherpesvirus 1]|uniref:Envelope glycoprotein E n=1 Tax=Herpesvirus ateles type 1 (strain Lennette) TaxID=35243 RepID=A0A1S6JLR8_HSVA1|nr:envelope glycoprotein E [Ateline alphaherpesvirus 1]AQS79225.1 envelope glycoprotein E [Ateline alphaherpesvirus 1]
MRPVAAVAVLALVGLSLIGAAPRRLRATEGDRVVVLRAPDDPGPRGRLVWTFEPLGACDTSASVRVPHPRSLVDALVDGACASGAVVLRVKYGDGRSPPVAPPAPVAVAFENDSLVVPEATQGHAGAYTLTAIREGGGPGATESTTAYLTVFTRPTTARVRAAAPASAPVAPSGARAAPAPTGTTDATPTPPLTATNGEGDSGETATDGAGASAPSDAPSLTPPDPPSSKEETGDDVSGEDGDGPATPARPEPYPTTTTTTTTAKTTPAATPGPRPHGSCAVGVRMDTHSALLFQAGETVSTRVGIRFVATDGWPYDVDVVWFRAPIPDGCAEMHIYEPCLRHPRLPECLNPADAPCAFGAPTHHVAAKHFRDCAATRTPPNCNAPTTGELSGRVRGLSWHHHSTNLQFVNATEAVNGVYLCAVYIDGHLCAWRHVVVSTANGFRGALVEHTLPRPGHRHPGGDDAAAPPGAHHRDDETRPPAARRRGLFLSVLLSIVAGLLVAAALTWLCLACRRGRAWRAAGTARFRRGGKGQRPPSPTYFRVPDDDLYADFHTSESDASSDEDAPYGAGEPRAAGRAGADSGSGFEIILPSGSSVFPSGPKASLRTFGGGR